MPTGVYKRPTPEKRFWRKVKKTPDGCWLWTGRTTVGKGYGSIYANGKCWIVSRFAYAIQVGPIPDGLLVCHHCDTPRCVRPDHLFLGTHKDNLQDAARKGRMARGERHASRLYPGRLPMGDDHWTRKHPERVNRGESNGNSKLTAEQVRQIRHALRGDETKAAIARRFGVTKQLIAGISTRRTWAHVED